MCAILGVTGDWKEDKVKKMLNWSRIRGLHAFGFSFVIDNEIRTEKFLDYNEFVDRILEVKPNKFIAHFRYSTSGDYMEMKNNQPIIKKDVVLVFNGVIDMATKEEMELKWNIELETENDGEIAIHKWLKGDINELISKDNITFAGIFLNKNNEIMAIRNELRPLHLVKEEGAVYLASTADILIRSGFNETKMLNEYEKYNF